MKKDFKSSTLYLVETRLKRLFNWFLELFWFYLEQFFSKTVIYSESASADLDLISLLIFPVNPSSC